MINIHFKITTKHTNHRLDKFLITQSELSGFSRAYLQKIIKNGDILVNDKKVKPSYKLKSGDIISGQIEPAQSIAPLPNPDIKLNIIYEDNDILVIDKPAGLTVHPSYPNNPANHNTLINGLLSHYSPIASVGENILRPGLVHRLDKDTSGLIIVAKNNEAFKFFKKQFQNRQIIKKYLALVGGCPKQEQGIIEAPITRSSSDPTKQKISFENKAKKAITEYKIIKKFGEKYCLVEASPKTGRMHQIRIHLAYLGHPIIGDVKYKGPKLPDLHRQFLHAVYLKFQILNGKDLELTSPLPQELRDILETIAKNHKN